MKNLYQLFLGAFMSFFFIANTQAQNINGTLTHDNLEREYILHVPSSYDENNPTPLVFALHGLGDNISNFSNVGLSPLADQENFFVVYPQAVDSQLLGTAWNNGASSSGITLNGDVDDLGFLSALIDHFSAEYNIDPTRVYSCGFSMGGIMTHHVACELSDRFAAFASVAGPISDIAANACSANRAIPIMHMHGTADGTVTYDNGEFNGFDAGLTGAEEAIDFWVERNNCDVNSSIFTELEDSAMDGYTIETFDYSSCDEESRVLLYKIYGADHTWLQANNDVNANVEIWEFFSQYTLDVVISNNNNITKSAIALYPNPIEEQVIVELPSGTFNQAVIYDLFGRTLRSISISEYNSTISIDCTNLQAGNYILQLNGDTEIQSLKIQKL